MSENTENTQHPLTVLPNPDPSGEGLNTQETEEQPEQASTVKQPPATIPEQGQTINILDLFEYFTERVTEIKDTQAYLQARSKFLNVLKQCERSLEIHEAKVLIPLLAEKKTDTIRFGKWEVNYKPSSKRVVDIEKLQAAVSPELFKKCLKPLEIKPYRQCVELLLRNEIYSDVFTTKQGKKPTLRIIDTNTIKRKLDEVDEAEDEAEEE